MPQTFIKSHPHHTTRSRAGYQPLVAVFSLLGLLLSLLLSLPSAQAQVRPRTPLGGPLVDNRAPRNENGTRLAQSGPGGEADDRLGDTTSSALGPPPFEVGTIRRVKVAGQLLNEPPQRVGNLDVVAPLVPAAGQTGPLEALGVTVTRAAAANLPGNASTPTNDQFFQINTPGADSPPIVMAINHAVAYIDGIEHPLRAAPVVIRGRIWLPVFSVAPLLGAATRLERDGTLHLNPTVQSVELFPVRGTLVLTIKTSAPLPKPLMGTLEDPPKLYLDFPNYSMGFDAANSKTERTVSSGAGEVTRVRAGLFQDFPDTTRIVLDLKAPLRGVSQPLPDPTLFALVLTSSSQPAPTRTLPTNPVSNVVGRPLAGVKIVVDAGHGGHDQGARGARSNEKTHTLDIARRLSRYLEDRGATVVMTRNTDDFISLQGRVDFAHSQNADLFISVHINSFRSNSTGTETYYYTPQSRALANEVHSQFIKATGLRNRGVLRARFYVIRNTRMPSILTETAFISNPSEEAKLLNPTWRDQVARGLAQGIINYAGKYMKPGTRG